MLTLAFSSNPCEAGVQHLRAAGIAVSKAIEPHTGLTSASLNTPLVFLCSNPVAAMGRLRFDRASFFSRHGSWFSQSLVGALLNLFHNYLLCFKALKSSVSQGDSL